MHVGLTLNNGFIQMYHGMQNDVRITTCEY